MHQRVDVSTEAPLEALASTSRCMSRLVSDDAAWRLGDRELVAGVDAAYRLVTQAHTAALMLLGELDRRGLAVATGAPSTQAWLTGAQRMRPQEAKRDVTLATLIGRAGASAQAGVGVDGTGDDADGDGGGSDGTDDTSSNALPVEERAVRSGLEAGDLNVDQAGCIATALAELPIDASATTRVLAEQLLVDEAGLHGPAALTRLGHRILERVDPAAADRRIAEQLAREERDARRLRSATRFSDGHGSVFYKLRIPIADDAYVWPVLDTLSRPCPRSSTADPGSSAGDRAPSAGDPEPSAGDPGPSAADPRTSGGDPGPSGGDPRTSGGDPGALGGDPGRSAGAAGPSAPESADDQDLRSPQQRLADAFVEAFRRVQLDGGLPSAGGDRPRVLIMIGWEQLRDGMGYGQLVDTGDQLSVDAVRRLCCDAQVIPVVLSGEGQVLDLGRARRTFDGPIRLAVVARDGGCVHPGCDRPPRWCDVHHVVPWWAGGPTSLDNGVLLCGYHHRLYDDGIWTLQFTAEGIPEAAPPAWIDPERRRRRNGRFYERHGPPPARHRS